MNRPKNRPLPNSLTEGQIRHFHGCINKRANDECWDWLMGLENGYGRCRIGRRLFLAHRIAYYIAHSVDPGTLEVCHSCDRPQCCNPYHLFLGEHAHNMQDAAKKERCNKKLTSAQAVDMRILHMDFEYSETALGKIFGVSIGLVSRIVNRHIRRSA